MGAVCCNSRYALIESLWVVASPGKKPPCKLLTLSKGRSLKGYLCQVLYQNNFKRTVAMLPTSALNNFSNNYKSDHACSLCLPHVAISITLYLFPIATTMFIAILVTCHVFQPIGFMLALIIAFMGFFVPMTRHRIPHEASWQNPVMLGGLIMGVGNTVICYFFAIWPHILTSYHIIVACTLNYSLSLVTHI